MNKTTQTPGTPGIKISEYNHCKSQLKTLSRFKNISVDTNQSREADKIETFEVFTSIWSLFEFTIIGEVWLL